MKVLGTASELLSYRRYVGGSVALESAVINLEVAILNINSSALEVACGPPGIGAKI